MSIEIKHIKGMEECVVMSLPLTAKLELIFFLRFAANLFHWLTKQQQNEFEIQ